MVHFDIYFDEELIAKNIRDDCRYDFCVEYFKKNNLRWDAANLKQLRMDIVPKPKLQKP